MTILPRNAPSPEHSRDVRTSRSTRLNRDLPLCGPNRATLEYDPRFLVFEFTWNLLLRKGQLDMVKEFKQTVDAGGSVCRQLIMGSGKTTVRGPAPIDPNPTPNPNSNPTVRGPAPIAHNPTPYPYSNPTCLTFVLYPAPQP